MASPGFYLPWLMSLTWLAGSEERGLREVFSWSEVDFDYPSQQSRDLARAHGRYKPSSVLPLGLEPVGDRLFITLPRWKKGIPATLAWVSLSDPSKSPLLKPYPNWSWHTPGDCNGITSVFRIAADECGRLWVLDTGVLEVVTSVNKVCSPQILVFNLKTNSLLWKYKIPKKQTPPGALLTNIAVEVTSDCQNTYAYISDVFRYGIIVYSLSEDKSWRVEHPYLYPDPLQSKYEIDGLKFVWNDGVFGLALSPKIRSGSRYLYFHPLSSLREFHVETRMLQNETMAKDAEMFKIVGEERMSKRGQSTGEAMSRNGILFYNLVAENAVGCWNWNLPHNPDTQGRIDQNQTTLSFPNDLKIDREPDQGLWVLSNKLHKFLYDKLDPSEVNFRVLTAKVRHAVRGTPCEPGFIPPLRKVRKCHEL